MSILKAANGNSPSERHTRTEIIMLSIVLCAMLVNLALSWAVEIQKQQELAGTCFAGPDSTGKAGSCETVTTSAYGWSFGISNSLLGIIAFALTSLLIADALWLYVTIKSPPDFANGRHFHLALVLLAIGAGMLIGMLFALYLIGLQFLVLHQFCTYCLWTDGIMTASALLFLFSFFKEIKQAWLTL